MSRQNLALIGVGILVLLALAFTVWAAVRPLSAPPTAVVTPSAEVAPSTEVTPPAEVTLTPTALPDALTVSSVITTDLYTLILPAGWQWTTQVWAGDSSAAVAQLAPVVVAWPPNNSFEASPTRLSIATMPRQALSLERYLLDVSEVFSNSADAGVVDARIVTDLRGDGLPVAYIRYIMSTPAGEVSGHQAATFDGAGSHLLIVTLAHPSALEEGERLFRALIGSLIVPAKAASGE
mgnify:CR=1 FL=1